MPLSTVVLVSMIKDAFEDYKRSVNDKTENVEKKAVRFNAETGKFEKTEWKNVKVGNIVELVEDEYLSADVLLL